MTYKFPYVHNVFVRAFHYMHLKAWDHLKKVLEYPMLLSLPDEGQLIILMGKY
jgi:hypothetical protein